MVTVCVDTKLGNDVAASKGVEPPGRCHSAVPSSEAFRYKPAVLPTIRLNPSTLLESSRPNSLRGEN